MCHARHQIDETYSVADGRLLFGKRLMRLAVGFVFDHPRRTIVMPVRGFAAFFVLDIVEVRLRATFFDKIFHQVQVSRFLRHVVKPHERQFNFRVTRITMQLVLARAKHAVDMIRQPAYHLQQSALPGSLEIRHASFNHMPGAV